MQRWDARNELVNFDCCEKKRNAKNEHHTTSFGTLEKCISSFLSYRV